jgi:hypothetical protein
MVNNENCMLFSAPNLFSYKGLFDLQNINTGQNNTELYKTEQHRTNVLGIEQILSFLIFDGQKIILVL